MLSNPRRRSRLPIKRQMATFQHGRTIAYHSIRHELRRILKKVAETCGIQLRVDIMPSFMWQEFLQREIDVEQHSMSEIAWNADFVLLTDCDDFRNDLCSILLAKPQSRFFEKLRRKYFKNDPDVEAKLQLAVDKLHQEFMRIFKRSGLRIDPPLDYVFQRRFKKDAFAFPLYTTVSRTI